MVPLPPRPTLPDSRFPYTTLFRSSWALPAVGIGLAWGRGGMLVLGQGVFFGLGGYAMAMHMKLEAAGPGNVPDFMQLYGDGTMPGWWEPFRSGAFTLFARSEEHTSGLQSLMRISYPVFCLKK